MVPTQASFIGTTTTSLSSATSICSMIVRTGVPLLAIVLIKTNASGPASNGFVIFVICFYAVGLLLDVPPFSFGVSLSMRSLPFNQGFDLDLPFQTALEAHWLIPNTQLFVSASVAGEFESASSYYLFGGVGLGILN